jgi:two-component system, OmpR family, phosphate regulon sensor histidine kinase PhoR
VRLLSALGGTRALAVLAALLIVAITAAPFWLTMPRLVRSAELDVLQTRLEAEARLLAVETRLLVEAEDWDRLGALAASAEDLAALRVRFADTSGAVLAQSPGAAADLNVPLNARAVQALDGVPVTYTSDRYTPGRDTMFVAVPIQSDGAVVGLVEIGRPLADVDSAMMGFWGALTTALVIAAVLAGTLALWLASRLSQPILALTKVANELAVGHYVHDVAVRGPGEVRQLGRALGRMAKALQESFASLEAERDRLDAVLDHMADGILIGNADGVVTLVNPAAAHILGINSARAVGQRLAVVVRDHEVIDVARRCLSSNGMGREFTATVERASPRRYLRVVATRVGDGRDVQVLLVLQDLTELRRLETVRRDFFANVSHELRTPIAAIKAMVETLEDGAIDDRPAAYDFLGRMNRETDGLSHLVEELLQLSRIESGQVSLSVEAIDPTEVVNRAVDRLAPLAERSGVNLGMEISPDIPRVQADRERVAQVLVNIVHNAIKFTPPGGSVTISVRPDQQGVVFSVSDTGSGIAEDDLPRLFERFYKVDKARASGGTGLGLAISKHLVQVQGGTIWAESAGPGQGATFTFVLPRAYQD